MSEEKRRTEAIRARRAERRSSATPYDSGMTTSRPVKNVEHRSPRKVGREASRYEPPVLVRSGRSGNTPAASHKGRRTGMHSPRRRYDLALNMPGAEIRLPSIPVIEVGWRWLSLLLVLILGGSIYYLWTAPTFHIKAAEISGLRQISQKEVNLLLGLTDKSIFTINPVALQEQIRLTFPEFSETTVKVGLPAQVSITVTERIPILIWNTGGKTYLVDDEGYSFPLRTNAFGGAPNVEVMPVVEANGFPPAPAPVSQEVETLILPFLGQQIPGVGSATPLLTLDMVTAVLTLQGQAPSGTILVYDQKYGLGWRDERGWDVYFGDAKSMEMKLRIYDSIVARLTSEEVQPELISVEHVHAPYYRLEH